MKFALAPAAALMALAAPLALSPGTSAPALAQSTVPAGKAMTYGSQPLQDFDYYRSNAEGARPLIVFVHGGAWAGGDKSDSTGEAKIRHYTGAGYQLASINYRLLPEVEIPQQADDVAAALAYMLDHAAELGIDTRRIVLMGHSAGAHLAALVATDPKYLRRYHLEPGDIGGVVLLDGAAYDAPRQIVDAGPLLGFMYQIAFGGTAQSQRALSPASFTDSPNARNFLMLHVQRPDAARQARLFADALSKNGTRAQVAGVPGVGMEGHNMINAMLGRRDSEATPIVDEFLEGLF